MLFAIIYVHFTYFRSQYLSNNSDLDEVFHRPLAWLWFTLAGLGFVTVFCYILIHKILINNARQLHRNLVSVLLRASITELDRNKKGFYCDFFLFILYIFFQPFHKIIIKSKF